MIPAAYADYSVIVQGLFLIGMIIGTIIAEFLFSGRLSDILVGRLAARKQGVKTPEMRLWLGYPSVVLVAVGLVVWGFSIERGWHWMTGQVAFALFGAGVQMGNTAVSSYIVDCYPEHAMDIITFYSVFLNVSTHHLA
jgi:MFS family permease